MNIIALDSSGMTASVSIVKDGRLAGVYTIDYKKTHSETLLPMLDELKRMTETDLSETDAIAVSAGPGSFTGLRIGAASAKGMAEALGKPIIAVPTLDALAWQFYGYAGLVCPMMDARRDQVYSGIYSFEFDIEKKEYDMCIKSEGAALACADQCRKINELYSGKKDAPVMLLGDGTDVSLSIIEETLKVPYTIAPLHRKYQDAGSLVTYATRLYEEGKVVDAASFAPEYFRVSQAERERAEKESHEV